MFSIFKDMSYIHIYEWEGGQKVKHAHQYQVTVAREDFVHYTFSFYECLIGDFHGSEET